MQILSRNCVPRGSNRIGFCYNFLVLIKASGKNLLPFMNLTHDLRPTEVDESGLKRTIPKAQETSV